MLYGKLLRELADHAGGGAPDEVMLPGDPVDGVQVIGSGNGERDMVAWWAGTMPSSSWVSRSAVWIKSRSSGSCLPPGKLICPAWWRRCGLRRVSSSCRPSARSTSGSSTAAGLSPATVSRWAGAGRCNKKRVSSSARSISILLRSSCCDPFCQVFNAVCPAAAECGPPCHRFPDIRRPRRSRQ